MIKLEAKETPQKNSVITNCIILSLLKLELSVLQKLKSQTEIFTSVHSPEFRKRAKSQPQSLLSSKIKG